MSDADPELVFVELSGLPDGDELHVGRRTHPLERGSSRWRLLTGGAAVVAVAAVVGIAFALPILEARLVSRFVALAVALLGLQFVVGQAGQLSLCHGAFVGTGSYATTIAASRLDLPVPVAIVFAPVVGFALGAMVGTLAVRLRATYLGPVTLSVAVVFPMIVKRLGWLTGGSSGMPLVRQMSPPRWLGLTASRGYQWNHIVIVAIAVAAVVVARNVRASQVGLAVRAVAANPLSAVASGIHVQRLRVVSYAWGAAFGALGGGLLVIDTPIVGADNYDLFRSLGYYAAVMVGGAASMLGAAFGAALLVVVPRIVEVLDVRAGPNLVLGVLLVVSTLVAPSGLVVPVRAYIASWFDVRERR